MVRCYTQQNGRRQGEVGARRLIVLVKEVVMKVRSSLRSLKNKAGSQVIRREGRVLVINRKNPRFNARQG